MRAFSCMFVFSAAAAAMACGSSGSSSGQSSGSDGGGTSSIVSSGSTSSSGFLGSGGSTASSGSLGPGGSTGSIGSTASSGSSGSGVPDAGLGAVEGGSDTGAAKVICPSPSLSPGDMTKTVHVAADSAQTGSLSRSYILHVPSAYTGSSAVPLVVDFHALGSSGSGEEGLSPYKAQTDPEGVITAYPTGESGPSGNAWNVGPCCVANVDDVAFARALVAQVETVTCIDTKRVYAVGFSMGGGMSHYVACHAADIFAAVAPASFDLLTENEDGCTPPRPIAEISFRSSNDTVVPYAGGASSLVTGMPVTFLGAVGTFQKWAQIDGCTGSPTAADSNDCQYYKSCQGGVEVGLCTMDSGHAPGEANIGWPFLKNYTLP